MKTLFFDTRIFAALMVGLAIVGQTGAASAPAPVSPGPVHVAEPEAFKSVFVNDPTVGKDPFFPNSTRRPIARPVIEAAIVTSRPDFPSGLVLKGISNTASKRMALINNATLAAGEEYDIKVSGQPIKVKCVEVKERSAIVSVNGVSKELELRRGL